MPPNESEVNANRVSGSLSSKCTPAHTLHNAHDSRNNSINQPENSSQSSINPPTKSEFLNIPQKTTKMPSKLTIGSRRAPPVSEPAITTKRAQIPPPNQDAEDNFSQPSNPLPPKRSRRIARPVGSLKIGKSPMDWANLKSKHTTLVTDPAPNGVRMVSAQELAEHCQPHNAWTCINNKVYELTPYLEFHPGGISTIMEAAGIDSTDLFNQYHSWVNCEMVLDKCFVGFMKEKPLERK